MFDRPNKGGLPETVLTSEDRTGIAGMVGEQSVYDRAAMGIIAITPMVGKAWVDMVAAEDKGGVCGMEYANCH